MPKFKKNPNPIMKKQTYGKGKSPFTMKYKNSAFPFRSDIADDLEGEDAIASNVETLKDKIASFGGAGMLSGGKRQTFGRAEGTGRMRRIRK